MSNMYGLPQVYIGGKEITNFSSIKIGEGGGTSINQCGITISDPETDENKLYNEEVVVYLNHGSPDSVPFFRGFIRQVNPTTKQLSITAYDPRTFLTGKESTPLSITDKNNYDGYTLVQFMHDYISSNVNINKTLIGLDMLNETDPPIILKGKRAQTAPYSFITGNIPASGKDINNVASFSIKMVDDGVKSNIVIVRERDISDTLATSTFSFFDGIEKLSFKRRPPPQFFNITTETQKNISFKRGNMPLGPFGQALKGKFKDTEEAIQAAVIQSELDDREVTEVNTTVTKHFYIGLGAVVHLNVDESELRGNHRVKSKSVGWGQSKGYTCSLILNKITPTIQDYLSPASPSS